MRSTLKAGFTTLAVVVLAVVALVPVAAANGMMGTPSPSPTMMATPTPRPSSTMMPTPTPSPTSPATPGGWCGGGMWGGTGAWGGTGMWGTGPGMAWLTSNPDALAAWTQLRADHVAAMQAWYGTYKADLTTPEAQQALHELWTKNWDDMKAFYEQYANGAAWTSPTPGMWNGWQTDGMMGGSWDPSHMWGAAHGASWMVGHSSGFRQWLAMRGRQVTAVGAWQHHYGADPGSSVAQAAQRTMAKRQRAQVRSFYMHHGLSATTARMRDGAGGWMGLGGMWGGFGW